MSLVEIDSMVDLAIARITEAPTSHRTVVRDLALGWPKASGLQIVFALVSAVNAIERLYPDDVARHPHTEAALRLAALLGTDLFALEKMGTLRPTGQDLLTYWDTRDPFFVTL